MGRAHEILKKCEVLREYSQFIDTVRKYSYEENAIKKAIRECIECGIKVKNEAVKKVAE